VITDVMLKPDLRKLRRIWSWMRLSPIIVKVSRFQPLRAIRR